MFYNFRKNKKAFTLVELIVVIAIIAVLATAAGIGVSSFLASSKKSSCKDNATTLCTTINAYGLDTESTAANLGAYIVEKMGQAEADKITWAGSANTKTKAQVLKLDATGIVYTHQGYKCTINVVKGNATVVSGPVDA